MARILFCWELGTGLGHLVPIASAGHELEKAGHAVAYALRDLPRAGSLFDLSQARLYQAPIFLPAWQDNSFLPETYADILRAIGYRNSQHLAALIAGWRRILADTRPDIVIYDHAPTAMLAARDLGICTIGLSRPGFTLPPATNPMPNLRDKNNNTQLARERETTGIINQALDTFGLKNIDTIGELFELDARILLSIPELDPYGPRDDAEYWGPLEHDFGVEPEWPDCAGKRIFVYVTRFDTLDAFLEILNQTRCPALVHVSGMGADECRQRSTTTLCLVPDILDMDRTLKECDLVVVHGGSMAASILLAGKPMLTLPLHLEHQLTATKIQALGAGLNAPQRRPQGMQQKLHRLLNESGFRESAESIAMQHRTDAPATGGFGGRFANLVEKLLASRQI